MLEILVLAEAAGFLAAMSVIAWLRYPSRNTDWHLGLLRFIGPPVAVLIVLVTISDLSRWLMGEQLGQPPPVSWVLIGGGVLAFSIARAFVEIRQGRMSRQELGPPVGRFRYPPNWPSERRRLRRRKRQERIR